MAAAEDRRDARTVRQARQLRKRMTDSEARLWTALRTRPGGLKWRRQHPITPWIVDFYCAEYAVAVEVDGDAHDDDARRRLDEVRDADLQRKGVKVLRVPAGVLEHRLTTVVRWITERTLAQPATRSPTAPPEPPARA